MPAHDTTKHGLSDAVPAFRMPTDATSLTGVRWIDDHNRHACQPRLVADELPQLRKGPIAASRSFRFPYRRPRADVRQIFERNRPLRVFGFLNKTLADAMVRILLKPALTTGQPAQMAFRRETAALLEPPAQVRVPASFAFNRSPAVPFAVAIRGKVRDAQVYPKHAVDLLLVRLRHVAHGQQVEHSLVVHQVAFAFAVRQQRALMVAQTVGDILSPIDRPDRHGVSVGIPRQVAVVKGNGAVRLERAPGLPIQLVGIGNFGNAANEDLRAETERALDLMIGDLLQGDTTKFARLPGNRTDRGARGVRFPQRGQQGRVLVGGWVQFDARDKLHTRWSIP